MSNDREYSLTFRCFYCHWSPIWCPLVTSYTEKRASERANMCESSQNCSLNARWHTSRDISVSKHSIAENFYIFKLRLALRIFRLFFFLLHSQNDVWFHTKKKSLWKKNSRKKLNSIFQLLACAAGIWKGIESDRRWGKVDDFPRLHWQTRTRKISSSRSSLSLSLALCRAVWKTRNKNWVKSWESVSFEIRK